MVCPSVAGVRVLLLSNLYPTGESPYAASFVTERIRALEACGHTVRPVGVRAGRRGPLATVAWVRGYPREGAVPARPYGDCLVPLHLQHRLRGRREEGRAPAVRTLAGLVADEGIDVVHGHGMYLPPAGSVAREVGRLAGVPYLVTVHGQDVNTLMARRTAHYRKVFEEAGAVVCVSQDLSRSVRGIAPDAAVHVVPNGYDPDTFFVGSGESRRGSDVLFVGNLEAVKGADRLPAFYDSLRELRPDAGLDVVGWGSLGPRLKTQLPAARFSGQVSPAEVAARMRSAGVLVVPSRSEGWGTVITEAYACGLPVVGFAVGGIPEAVQVPHHLVPAEEGVPALARRVADVLAERTSPRELNLLIRGCTWADVARAEERIYRDVVSGSTASQGLGGRGA